MARLRQMLPTLPDGAALEHFLPPAADDQPNDMPLQRRAALASTLMAGLELSREGNASVEQSQPFGRIVVTSAPQSVR